MIDLISDQRTSSSFVLYLTIVRVLLNNISRKTEQYYNIRREQSWRKKFRKGEILIKESRGTTSEEDEQKEDRIWNIMKKLEEKKSASVRVFFEYGLSSKAFLRYYSVPAL